MGFESIGCIGWATIATAGVMAIAKANPPASIKRRGAIGYVFIELPFAVIK
jgi:hypothetical protein